MPFRSALAIVMLALMALGLFAALERIERAGRRADRVEVPNIDYRLFGVSLSLFDAETGGKVQLRAAQIQHLRKEDELQIDKPNIDRFGKAAEINAANARQNLQAASARLFKQGQSVLLYGGVTLKSMAEPSQLSAAGSLADEPSADLTLNTKSLWLYPAEKRAETSQTVQIQQAQTTLSGKGLKADFATQSLEILQNVQARVTPQAHTTAKAAGNLIR